MQTEAQPVVNKFELIEDPNSPLVFLLFLFD